MANPQKENGYTAISNELMEAFAKIRIPGEARQMLDVIIRKTYGFNKKEDRIATSQIIELTGLNYRNIYKCRKKLKQMNLITISKKGDSQMLTYSIQKDYNKWLPSPKKETISKKGEGYLQKRVKTLSQLDIHKRQYKSKYTKDNIIPPDIKDVLSYCQERKNMVDAETWYNHYTAKGWLIGKTKMVDWKAAVRTWEKNSNISKPTIGRKP